MGNLAETGPSPRHPSGGCPHRRFLRHVSHPAAARTNRTTINSPGQGRHGAERRPSPGVARAAAVSVGSGRGVCVPVAAGGADVPVGDGTGVF